MSLCIVCLPVIHWWKRHGATVHSLRRWRRQRDLVVVNAAQCPTLIGHHSSSSTLVFTCAPGPVPCGHLGSQDTGRRARVGVGVASMVHGVGVVELISTVSPGRDNGEEDNKEGKK